MGAQLLLVMGVGALLAAMWFGIIDPSFVTSLIGDPTNPDAPVYDQVTNMLIGNMAVIVVGVLTFFIIKALNNTKFRMFVAGSVVMALFIVAVLPNL